MSMRYAVIIEKGGTGYSAYVPDLPGCIAAAATEPEVRLLIREAVEFHMEGLQRHGDLIPEPSSLCEYAGCGPPRRIDVL
jgi:predicted RNase H-like HicB family nuclease